MDDYSCSRNNLKAAFFIALSQLQAEDIFIPISTVTMFELEDSYDFILEAIKNNGFSRYPVYQDGIDNIVGILHVKDLLGIENNHFNIKNILRTPFFISENKQLDKLFTEMVQKRMLLSIVVDEYGSVRGIITMEDILETCFGHILDEFDPEEKDFTTKMANNKSFLVDARMPLSDFNKSFNASLQSEDSDTIAGFIIDRLGHVPEQNEVLKFDDLQIKINKVNGSKLIELMITKT